MKITNVKYLLVLLAFMPFVSVNAQTDSTSSSQKKIAYNKDFAFKEGIYMSFGDLKENNPIPKNRIITKVPHDDYEFFDKVLGGRYFFILDNLGSSQRIKTKAVWGYVSQGEVYIYFNGMFNRIAYFGGISHFLSEKEVYDNYGGGFYYDYTLNRRMRPVTTTETREYVLSMFSGRVMEYNTKSVSALLMRDPELHDKYQQLSRKKRNQLKFFYIRKFNKRNKFYIYPEK